MIKFLGNIPLEGYLSLVALAAGAINGDKTLIIMATIFSCTTSVLLQMRKNECE